MNVLLPSSHLGIVIKDTDLGTVESMQTADFTLTLLNQTSRPVTLVGSNACCGLKITSYPSIVRAGASGTIVGSFRVLGEESTVMSEGTIYVEDNGLVEVPFRIFAKATENEFKNNLAEFDSGESILEPGGVSNDESKVE